MNDKFLYFAYGSNMLAKRIHINNPTAVRRDVGFLKKIMLYGEQFGNYMAATDLH
ncbi:PREDICTED: gamma-glutamylcyclotransferase-like [Habropoda laboriosa]|uniref:gamma-glutamylcyclotransferase-like n=1 Tax=Habropoda laboriosa TaxID=597456 RepID=UPI00083DE6FE|nr:PREDICTED: gamma-glutamylcyclotransferase-like [Habropoda laboriosa]